MASGRSAEGRRKRRCILIRQSVLTENRKTEQAGGIMKFSFTSKADRSQRDVDGRKRKACFCLLFFTLSVVFLYWQNNGLTITEYDIVNKDLPQSFNGCTIVQISDLHNKSFGREQKKLVRRIKACEPDVIVLTGDLVDSNRPDVDTALELVSAIADLAPVYFVTGNHDNWLSAENTDRLIQGLEAAGVHVLKDEVRILTMSQPKETIYMAGIDDASLASTVECDKALKKLTARKNPDDFMILLAHEPQRLEQYAAYGVSLVLSGHAHGGQFRIPFIGGFVAPDQGFLPAYTEGVFHEKDTDLVISRGLGNSVIPIRLLNRPELVKVTLYSKNQKQQ